MTLMGMIMRAISDIVYFSCSKPVGGGALKGEEVIREMIRGEKEM